MGKDYDVILGPLAINPSRALQVEFGCSYAAAATRPLRSERDPEIVINEWTDANQTGSR